MIIHCSLCSMEFDTGDALIKVRQEKHTEFHAKARIQGRNTTQGVPEYG